MSAFGILAGAACREPEAAAALPRGHAPLLGRLTGLGPVRNARDDGDENSHGPAMR